MIKSVQIKNFQSHENSTLHFDKGVNIIIGASDSGKTAIIRALRWVIWNRPSGDAIRSNWGGITNVRLETEEGSVIRSKDPTDSYTLNKDGFKAQEFKAFRTDVPEEISRFLNISDVNLQMQLDAPFLLSRTSGEVAQHFNKVANLEKIDHATSCVNSWISGIKSDISRDESSIKDKESKLGEFDYLEEFEADLQELEANNKRLESLKMLRKRLESLKSNIEDIQDELSRYKNISEIEQIINNCITLNKRKIQKDTTHYSIFLLRNKIETTQSKVEGLNNLISLEKIVTKILPLYDTKYDKQMDLSKLEVLVSKIKQKMSDITNKDTLYNNLIKEFDQSFPERCPLCNSSRPHTH